MMIRLPARLCRAALGCGLLLATAAFSVREVTAQSGDAGPAAGPGSAASGAPAAGGGDGNGAQPAAAAEPTVVTFGTAGEKGSYKLWFEPRGGSVRAIQLLDHYRSAEAREREVKESGDYYLIADVPDRQAAPYSFVLEELNDSFPKVDTALDTWRRVETGAGQVGFALDCGDGVELRKIVRRSERGRGLELRIELRVAEGATPKIKDAQLQLRGLSLLNPVTEHIFGQNPALGIALVQTGDERTVQSVRPTGEPGTKTLVRGELVFAGTTNRFFASFLRPVDAKANRALRAVSIDNVPGNAPIEKHKPYSIPVAIYELDLDLPAPGGVTAVDYEIYLGPKSARIFDEHPEYEAFDAVLDIDLSPVCFCDIPGARTLAKLLLWTLRGLHDIVGNWGIAIILLTVLVRSLMLPLNFRMQKSMRVYGAKMARVKPQLDALQAKVKKDPKKYQKEMIAFQREHKLFPPVGGCLPMMLVSFPVFIGLFTALRVAYELRNQPFFGWIHDLSQPDMLFVVGQSWMPYFNLLPIIMVCLWVYLQFATPLPKDPQQRQMMQIMRFMPLMFGLMLYNYASGLMVYMITSSLYALVETRVTKRILGPMPTAGGINMPTTF